jgi:hypothetical protein
VFLHFFSGLAGSPNPKNQAPTSKCLGLRIQNPGSQHHFACGPVGFASLASHVFHFFFVFFVFLLFSSISFLFGLAGSPDCKNQALKSNHLGLRFQKPCSQHHFVCGPMVFVSPASLLFCFFFVLFLFLLCSSISFLFGLAGSPHLKNQAPKSKCLGLIIHNPSSQHHFACGPVEFVSPASHFFCFFCFIFLFPPFLFFSV